MLGAIPAEVRVIHKLLYLMRIFRWLQMEWELVEHEADLLIFIGI